MKYTIPAFIILLLCLATAAFAQSGDDPCTATTVTFTNNACDTTTNFQIAATTNATTSLTPSPSMGCSSGIQAAVQDRWFKFTVPSYPSSGVRFKLYSQSSIVYFAMYSSPTNNCGDLQLDSCGICKNPSSALITDPLGKFAFYFPSITVGNTYWVRVWEEVAQLTPITLKTGIIVLNDNCANAQPLEGESCNFGASGSEPESWTPDGGAQGGANHCTGGGWNSNENAVWYVFDVTAATVQPITMSVFDVRCFDGFNRLQMGIWTNHNTCDLSQETLMACATGVDTVRIADITLPIGQYYFFMDGSAGAQCRWTFESLQLLGSMTTDAPHCAGEPITITGHTRPKPNCTYNYKFAGESITGVWDNGASDTYTVTNPIAGSYSVTITETAANGSTLTVVGRVTVVVRPLPAAPTLPLISLRCGGGCGPINAGTGTAVAPYTTWVWNNGNTTRIAQACTQGVYTVTVSTQYGCTATATTTVDSLLPLRVWAHSDYADCTGNNGRVTVDSTRGSLGVPYTYFLDNATAQPDTFFTGVRTGTYVVWAQDALGCRNSDTVQVRNVAETLPPVAIAAHTVHADCEGLNGTIAIDAITGGIGAPYMVRFNGGAAAPQQPQFAGLNIGNYTIIASDSVQCKDTITVNIPKIDPPIFTITAVPPVITVGDSTRLEPQITAGHIIAWVWADAESLTCAHCAKPIAMPYITTTYTVTATDDNTCTATQMVTVQVISKLDVYAPTAITPNGDGYNDIFTLYGGRSLTLIQHLQVFDRWGELIYDGKNLEPNSTRQGWDGTLHGQPLAPNVFVWTAEVLLSDGRVLTLHGDVTVVY
jgi:gliding motility-associated-like protein